VATCITVEDHDDCPERMVRDPAPVLAGAGHGRFATGSPAS
jgi:hypothetical protein